MPVLLNSKQFQMIFRIKSNSHNVAKNKNSRDFLRLNTGFTDDGSGLLWANSTPSGFYVTLPLGGGKWEDSRKTQPPPLAEEPNVRPDQLWLMGSLDLASAGGAAPLLTG